MEFVDSHFHLWETEGDAPPHNGPLLGPPAALHPQYTLPLLMSEFAASKQDGTDTERGDQERNTWEVSLVGAVHIEAIPNNDLQEIKWVREHLASVNCSESVSNGDNGSNEGDNRGDRVGEDTSTAPPISQQPFPVVVVGRVDLSADDVLEQLDASVEAAGPAFRGIRMILNYEPTWPKVDRGDFLTSSDFERGFAALADRHLSFDLQVNPHQLCDAAVLAAKYPNVPVIVNHFGCLKLPSVPGEAPATSTLPTTTESYFEQLGEDGVQAIATWRKGMRALANAGDHVYLKLSMLCYTDPNWDSGHSIVVPLVKEAITMFGAQRCLFASNYPVDKADGWLPSRLLRGFHTLTTTLGLSDDERSWLYSKTAKRAYRIQ